MGDDSINNENLAILDLSKTFLQNIGLRKRQTGKKDVSIKQLLNATYLQYLPWTYVCDGNDFYQISYKKLTPQQECENPRWPANLVYWVWTQNCSLLHY